MSGHSALGPSAAKRWINCPGSVALIAQRPRVPAGVFAAEGTVAHKVAEEFLTEKVSFEAMCLKMGQKVMQEGHEITISEEMIDGALEYREAVEAAKTYFTQTNKPSAVVERFEEKVVAKSLDPEHGRCWGTSDHYIYRKGDVLFVDDYKFGRRVVPVVENDQLAEYAVGVMDSEAGWAFNEVVFRIIQPRAMDGGETTREWRTTPKWLKKWRDEKAAPAAAETLKSDARLAGGDWCSTTYCPLQGDCKALEQRNGQQAQVDFALIPLDGAKKTLPDPKFMTTEEQIRCLRFEGDFDSWFNAIRTSLHSKSESGEPTPGGKLVQGRANRQWVDEELVKEMYAPFLGEALYKKKILSPAQVEGALKLKKKDTASLTHTPPGKVKFVLDEDVRPAQLPSAQNDFPTQLEKEVAAAGTVWPL